MKSVCVNSHPTNGSFTLAIPVPINVSYRGLKNETPLLFTPEIAVP